MHGLAIQLDPRRAEQIERKTRHVFSFPKVSPVAAIAALKLRGIGYFIARSLELRD
jgi:hypothetical protein